MRPDPPARRRPQPGQDLLAALISDTADHLVTDDEGQLERIEILRRSTFGDVFDTGVHDDQTREPWALATIGDVALQPGPN